MFIPSNANLGCTWIQKDGYFVEEGHTKADECYNTLKEAKEKCIASQDCHAIATQTNVCGGKYRVSHGGPTFKPHSMYDVRAWEHYCRGNDNLMRYLSYCGCKVDNFIEILPFNKILYKIVPRVASVCSAEIIYGVWVEEGTLRTLASLLVGKISCVTMHPSHILVTVI